MGKHFKNFITTILLCLAAFAAHAQFTENQGWLFISHTQKLDQKFDLLVDVQIRSANKFDYLNTLLLRTALKYNFSKKHSVALGYAHKADREQEMFEKVHITEHRIYQQYLYDFKLHKIEATLRTRLEQRWVNDEGVNFSQRARIFFSTLIPLNKDTTFVKGVYANIQNELFVNITNRQNVNGSFVDQNRLLGSIGYRWNKHIDTELGYMYWYQKELDNTYRRNILQLMVTTNF